MIKVTLDNYDEIRYLKLLVQDHAGSDVIGHDLVCASASILLYTFAEIVEDLERRGELVSSLVDVKEGDSLITCQCITDRGYAEAVNAFNVIRTGYKLLAENCPQYVELNTVGKAVTA